MSEIYQKIDEIDWDDNVINTKKELVELNKILKIENEKRWWKITLEKQIINYEKIINNIDKIKEEWILNLKIDTIKLLNNLEYISLISKIKFLSDHDFRIPVYLERLIIINNNEAQKIIKEKVKNEIMKEGAGLNFRLWSVINLCEDKEYVKKLIIEKNNKDDSFLQNSLIVISKIDKKFTKKLVKEHLIKLDRFFMFNHYIGDIIELYKWDEQELKTIFENNVIPKIEISNLIPILHNLVLINKDWWLKLIEKDYKDNITSILVYFEKLSKVDYEWTKKLLSKILDNSDNYSSIIFKSENLLDIASFYKKKDINWVKKTIYKYMLKNTWVVLQNLSPDKRIKDESDYDYKERMKSWKLESIWKALYSDKKKAEEWSKNTLERLIKENTWIVIKNYTNIWIWTDWVIDKKFIDWKLEKYITKANLTILLEKGNDDILEAIQEYWIHRSILLIMQNLFLWEKNPIKIIKINKLWDDRYIKILDFIWKEKLSIYKNIELANYLIFEMDYPLNKVKESIKKSNNNILYDYKKWIIVTNNGLSNEALKEINKKLEKKYNSDNFNPVHPEYWDVLKENKRKKYTIFSIIWEDYTKTDSNIAWINLKDFEWNSLLSNFSHFLQENIEEWINLKKFDIKNIDSYRKILFYLKTSNQTNLEKEFFNWLDFSELGKQTENLNISEKVKIIKSFKNTVHPNFLNIFIEELSIDEDIFIDLLKKYTNKETKKLDLNKNNVSELVALLELIEMLGYNISNKIVKEVFNYIPKETVDSKEYIISSLKINKNIFDNIDLKNLLSILNLKNIVKEKGLLEIENKISKWLENIDVLGIFLNWEINIDTVTNMSEIENLRLLLNSSWDRIMWDSIVIEIIWNFLDQTFNLKDRLKFAKTWKSFSENIKNKWWYNRDVSWIYNMWANFWFTSITSFIENSLNDNPEKFEKYLEKNNYTLEKLINQLHSLWINFEIKQSNAAKAVTRILNWKSKYVVNKVITKIEWVEEDINVWKIEKKEVQWSKHEWVELFNLDISWITQAKLITIKNDKLKTKLLMSRDWMVNMKRQEKDKKWKLIFSAPLAFTTWDHKMTDAAYMNWKEMNALFNPDKNHWLVMTNSKWEIKVLNKNKLKLSDFNIPELIKNWDRELNITSSIRDYMTFIKIIKKYKLSILLNMLLIDNWKISPFKTDNKDSRRFLVTFEDWRVWILYSEINMSTKKLMMIAKSIWVKNAVYMDTWMYDMATYYEPDWKKHILWHQDTDKSTNRVIFSIREN